MVLHVQSDASYLSRNNARLVAGAIFYIGNKYQPEIINGSILALSTIILAVVASVAEAEYAALFLAAQEAVNLRNILHDLGYTQSPTNILCDNACAVGLATNTVKKRRSKSIDMRWRQQETGWSKISSRSIGELADFFTKILSVATHKLLMPLLVTIPPAQRAIFGRKHTNLA